MIANWISLVLESQYGIGFQVRHVDSRSVLSDIRVLFAHQPTHMREEKPSAGIVLEME